MSAAKKPHVSIVPREPTAYTPGDYHLFFDDPRTRELYLKWAPFMLTAEDFHGGKLEAQDAQKAFDAEQDRNY